VNYQPRVPTEPVTNEELKPFAVTFNRWCRQRGEYNPRIGTLMVFLEVNAPGFKPYTERIWGML